MTRRLLVLNGLATLMLGIHHASGYGFSAMFMWTDRYLPVDVPNYDLVGSLPYYVIIVIQQLDYFALPAFMFVSGFFASFMIGGGKLSDQVKNIRTRIINLMIPFLLWSIVFFVLFLHRLPANLDELMDRYYYIPLVMQCYALSPLFIPLAKKNWRLFMLGSIILEMGRYSLRYIVDLGLSFPGLGTLIAISPRWLLPNLLIWFSLGLVASIYREELMSWLPKYRWHILTGLIITACLTFIEYAVVYDMVGEAWLGPYFGGFSRYFYALAFLLSFLAFDSITLPFTKHISDLGSKSLAIYLAHSRIMYLVAVILYERLPWILGSQFLYQGILIVSAIGGSLLLIEAVKRTPARRYYRYIFG